MGPISWSSCNKYQEMVSIKIISMYKELCWYMHQQGLLDRQEFLQSVLEMVEKCKNPEDPLFRLLMPTLLRKPALRKFKLLCVVFDVRQAC
jgi:hypothetical protein